MPRIEYSVWSPSRAEYDYYEALGELRAGVIAPAPTLSSRNPIGIAPDDAARPLPAGATKTGSGPIARGLIAARTGPLAALGAVARGVDPIVWVGIAAAGWYLYWRR